MARKIYDVDQVLTGLAQTFMDPEGADAFQHDTYAYLVARIQRPESGVQNTDSLVLLGKQNDVVHAIIARGDEIIADRQIDVLGIDSSYDSEKGAYTTKLASGLKTRYVLGVAEQMSLQDFYYKQGLQNEPPAAVYDHMLF